MIAVDEVDLGGRAVGRGYQGIERMLLQRGIDPVVAARVLDPQHRRDVVDVVEPGSLFGVEENPLVELRHLLRGVRVVEGDHIGQAR